MADEITVQAKKVGAELKIAHRAYLVEGYRDWPEGADVTITVTRARPKLSDLQRGYWFAVVVPIIADYTGDEADSVHHDLMTKYGPKVTHRWKNKITGRWRKRTRRPSIMSLTTKQMTEVIDLVRRDFGNDGVEIPEPDPLWRQKGRAA